MLPVVLMLSIGLDSCQGLRVLSADRLVLLCLSCCSLICPVCSMKFMSGFDFDRNEVASDSAIMGIWSEGVMGPGLMSMYCNALLLV